MQLQHVIKTPETFTYLPGPTGQAVVYVGDYSVVANVQLQPGWELPAGSAVTEKAHVFFIPAFGPMNHPLTAARDLWMDRLLRPEDPRLNVVAVAQAGTYPALTEEFSAGLS